MTKITVTSNYNGKDYPVDPVPAWLQERIDSVIPFLSPGKPHTRLVCSNVAGAMLVFGQYAPVNGGYKIDIDND
jgi:hypothetical protein